MSDGTNDMVEHPPHYCQGGIECIDALREQLGREQFVGFLRGTVAKYLWRGPHKLNELEDYKKARWYLERLIRELEGE